MLGTIIPVIDAIKANKRLKEKIAKQEVNIPEYIDDIDIKCLEDDYKVLWKQKIVLRIRQKL